MTDVSLPNILRTLRTAAKAQDFNEKMVRFYLSKDATEMMEFLAGCHPESPEFHFELKRAVMAMGFCPRCEWRPCECEGKYDD